jgi:hypothetical protein
MAAPRSHFGLLLYTALDVLLQNATGVLITRSNVDCRPGLTRGGECKQLHV